MRRGSSHPANVLVGGTYGGQGLHCGRIHFNRVDNASFTNGASVFHISVVLPFWVGAGGKDLECVAGDDHLRIAVAKDTLPRTAPQLCKPAAE